MDGGSENTAKAALAICELLVARRLTRRVILSRLLVGHTHEDIDAIFAIIWQFLKNKKVMTPQIYANLLVLACQNKAKSVDVIDIWAVPDYQDYFDGYINPDLGSYAKGKWSQLQVFFEAVDMSEKYPMGVKVSHRAFASDRVKLFKRLPNEDNSENVRFKDLLKEIMKEAFKDNAEGNFPGIIFDENEVLEDENSDEDEENSDLDDGTQVLNVGFKPIEMIVETFENQHSILKSFPSGDLKPQAFVEGSIDKIKRVAAAVKAKFNREAGVIRDWNAFLANIPKSDDADEYVRDHPLYIPFRKELFQIDEGYATTKDAAAAKVDQAKRDAEAEAMKKRPDIEIWRSLPCMTKKSKIPFERVKSIIGENGRLSSIFIFECLLPN